MTTTTDLTPSALIRQLVDLSQRLEGAQRSLAAAERDATTARHAATLAEAKAYLGAEGTVDERKRTALIASEAETLAADTADTRVRLWRGEVKVLTERIGVGRTLCAGSRTEWANTGGTP